jgi:hypothetical protein
MLFIDEEYTYNYFCEKTVKYKTNFTNGEWLRVDFDDVKIGDNIIIEFISDSQRYMYSYYPKYGEVIHIKDDNEFDEVYFDKSFFFSSLTIERLILNNENGQEIGAYSWDSYFGNIRSYSYLIYKFVKDSDKEKENENDKE